MIPKFEKLDCFENMIQPKKNSDCFIYYTFSAQKAKTSRFNICAHAREVFENISTPNKQKDKRTKN